jgi:hypothetical protein
MREIFGPNRFLVDTPAKKGDPAKQDLTEPIPAVDRVLTTSLSVYWYLVKVETLNAHVHFYHRSFENDGAKVLSLLMEAEEQIRSQYPDMQHFLPRVCLLESVDRQGATDTQQIRQEHDDYVLRCMLRMPLFGYPAPPETQQPQATPEKPQKPTEPGLSGVLAQQHGGDHYKQAPPGYQPVEIGHILGLNPSEYSVLKYLLRHKRREGAKDVKKMLHFGQFLLKFEYGVESQLTFTETPKTS